MSVRHRYGSELLADYAARRLDARSRPIVEEHLAECADCREWLETYRLLASGLATEQTTGHLPSADLAAWAVLEDQPPGKAVAHLAACATCGRELELVTAAIRAARREGHEEQPASWWRPGGRRRAVWLAAASLVLVVLAGSLLLTLRGGTTQTYEISGVVLAGEETFTARSIHASDVEIRPASEIVFQAEELVVLGEDFVVASQATFEAGITPPSSRGAAGKDRRTQPSNLGPI